jgi:tetratricopeptide (TPR) repeat protein
MNKLLLISLLTISFLSFGQSQGCYTEFLNKGISAYNALDFETAILQFNAAKICDDAPGGEEVNEWITRSQSGYIDAIKAARDEAISLKSEAVALRFFVKGQEREFKGFYLEAMDNYDACVIEQPIDTLFRERRAQLAMSEDVAQFRKAENDLRFLLANGNPNKRAEYNDDLAYVLERLDDLEGAIVAQTSAASSVPTEQKALYDSKLGRLQQKSIVGNFGGSNLSSKVENSFVRLRPQKGYIDCQLDIRLKIAGKNIRIKNGRFSLENIKTGTYAYEITGEVSCDGSPKWPAIGKGTLTIRSNTVYYLYWEKTKYGKCDMWINNY